MSTFSICIPNYNYERYLGITLDSVLAQTYADLEIVIADNQSTDGSVALVKRYQERHANIRLKVNRVNLGFAGNLDQVGAMAQAPRMIMLSSDDVMKPDALAVYDRFIEALPKEESWVITSSNELIDAEGRVTGVQHARDVHKGLWKQEDLDPALSASMGFSVYKVPAATMLRRMLLAFSNPFHFLATCYRREDYEAVGGYTSSRLINPDKWFHWRLTGVADFVYFLDMALFQYRWHPANQNAQERNSGHLKYMVDEYRNTIELSPALLQRAGLSKEQVYQAFIDNDVFRHGLGELSRGYWLKALRIYFFGWGVFPRFMIKRWGRCILYKLLLISGPLGILLLQKFKPTPTASDN